MKLWYHSKSGKALGTIPILLALCGCVDSATRVVNPNVSAFDAPTLQQQRPTTVVDHPCAGMAIITPTPWGYTWTNPCNGTFGAGTNGFIVTEIQTHPSKGLHQFSTNVCGPWSPLCHASYIYKWTGPLNKIHPAYSKLFYKGPPGAVTIISYWSRTNVPEISYNVPDL